MSLNISSLMAYMNVIFLPTVLWALLRIKFNSLSFRNISVVSYLSRSSMITTLYFVAWKKYMISSRCLLKIELFSFISISPSFRLSLLSFELLYDFINPLMQQYKKVKTYTRQNASMKISLRSGISLVRVSMMRQVGEKSFQRARINPIHANGFQNSSSGFVWTIFFILEFGKSSVLSR